MRHLTVLLLAIITAVACVGCYARGSQSYDAYRMEVDHWSYPKYAAVTTKDLVMDFFDIVSVETSFGPGLLLDIQPTKLLELGGGYEDALKLGWRNRFIGWWQERRFELGASMLYHRDLDFTPVFGALQMWNFPRKINDFPIRYNVDRHWLDIGAQAHIIWFGAGVWVSPTQAVDFVFDAVAYPYNIILRRPLNWLNFRPPEYDFMNDDTLARVRAEANVKLVDPGVGFLPAEKINELFLSMPY